MKKILLALLFLPISALAEDIPPGCYVADYYRTDPCWVSIDGYHTWAYFPSRTDGVYYYGSAVEAIINQERIGKSRYIAAESDLDAALLANEFHSSNLTATTAKLSKANSLVKRLRNACGSKCKRIK